LDHEVLRVNDQVFDVTIREGGADYSMFSVFGEWVAGGTRQALVTPAGGIDNCQ
jgi:hypothetical protein